MSEVLPPRYSRSALAEQLEKIMADLPRDVARTRDRRDVSFREAAKAAGVSHMTIYKVELGKRVVDVDTLCALLRWLDGAA